MAPNAASPAADNPQHDRLQRWFNPPPEQSATERAARWQSTGERIAQERSRRAARFATSLESWVAAAPPGEGPQRAFVQREMHTAYRTQCEALLLPGLGLSSLPDCLHELVMLQELDLSGNRKLECLPALPPYLRQLNVQQNRLTRLPPLPKRLKKLLADDNRLAEVRWLPKTLEVVELSNNDLQSLPGNRHFPEDQYPNLKKLTVRGNRLTTLPQSLLAAKRLMRIDLSANRLDEDTIDALRYWLIAVRGRTLDFELPSMGEQHLWQFPDTGLDAVRFNRFIERLAETGDYAVPAFRAMLIGRVDTLVQGMRESTSLRERCFDLAWQADGECGDRVALGINDMELARIDEDAAAGRYTNEQLFGLGRAMFRAQVVDEIAGASIATLEAAALVPELEVDPVEIRLGYQVFLGARLGLPGATESMLYAPHADINWADYDYAEREVRAQEHSPRFMQFMEHWQPWRRAMERQHPQVFATMASEIAAMREVLPVAPPPEMSDQAWRAVFDKQIARENALLHAVMAPYFNGFA